MAARTIRRLKACLTRGSEFSPFSAENRLGILESLIILTHWIIGIDYFGVGRQMPGFLTRMRERLGRARDWVLRRPQMEPTKLVGSKAGSDVIEGQRSHLSEKVVREWNVPLMKARDVQTLKSLHSQSIGSIFEQQPRDRLKELTKHILLTGAMGLSEAGAEWLSTELIRKEWARQALRRAYTSDNMASFVAGKAKSGIIFNRKPWTNSALVMHGNAVEAGTHLYDALINDRKTASQLRNLIARAHTYENSPNLSELKSRVRSVPKPTRVIHTRRSSTTGKLEWVEEPSTKGKPK